MYVVGLQHPQRRPRGATSAANFGSAANDAESFAASSSANQNPALCRVAA